MRTNRDLKRYALITALGIVLFCTTISNEALAAPFHVGQFITYSQDNWGSQGSAGEQILVNHFSEVYPNGVEVGIPGITSGPLNHKTENDGIGRNKS